MEENYKGESVTPKLATKRQRSENWKEEDKELLKDLVRKNVRAIENKNTDTNSNQNKKKAWSDLEKDFNILASEMRTLKQLKTQWTALKIQAKKEVAQFRTESKKTGGGVAPASVEMSGNDIEAWLPNEFITDYNEFDSDVPIDKVNELEINDFVEIEYLSEEDVSHSEQKDDFYATKKVVEETPKKNKTLCTPKKKAVKPNKDQLIQQIASVDVECRRELHKYQVEVELKKMRNMDAECELQQLQLEVEKKKLRNMDAEYEVMLAKIKYFKIKAFDDTEV